MDNDLYIIGNATKTMSAIKCIGNQFHNICEWPIMIFNESDYKISVSSDLLKPLLEIYITMRKGIIPTPYGVSFDYSKEIKIYIQGVDDVEHEIDSPNGTTKDIYVFRRTFENNIDIHTAKCTVTVTVKRLRRFNESKKVLKVQPLNYKQTINIPILDIVGQTLIDGSDIGQMIFTIKDQFQYYNEIPVKFNKCGTYDIDPSELKITIFEKSCPKIVSVVIGNEKTWYDKTEAIFLRLNQEKIGTDFGDFRRRMLFYAMLKYILSRILYGIFNINFLLRKYDEKFIKDLKNSRFCEASSLFTDPNSIIFGYNKYFKFD